MKNNSLILAALLLISVGGYLGYYHFAIAGTASMLCEADGEMEWLRQEFKLSEDQFQKIKALHTAYRPKCDQMCARIAKARVHLDLLIDTNKSVTPELETAFKGYALLEEECKQAMLGHIYEVSNVMPREGQSRYLEKMKQHLLQSHSGSKAMRYEEHSH